MAVKGWLWPGAGEAQAHANYLNKVCTWNVPYRHASRWSSVQSCHGAIGARSRQWQLTGVRVVGVVL
jgi:hypothetical protein